MSNWKPVIDLPDHFEVSDDGQVRSLITGKYPKASLLKSGHVRVFLSGRSRTVHSLVATSFIGPYPDGHEVRHINGVPSDNRVGNLVYGTKSENSYDSITHGTHFQAMKTHCKRGHEFTLENTQQADKNVRSCLACRRMRYANGNGGDVQAPTSKRTHCPQGHEYSEENTATTRRPGGGTSRRCRTCHRDRESARLAARRGADLLLAPKDRTHCPSGHEYTEVNTKCRKRGGRECKTCNLEKARARYRASK